MLVSELANFSSPVGIIGGDFINSTVLNPHLASLLPSFHPGNTGYKAGNLTSDWMLVHIRPTCTRARSLELQTENRLKLLYCNCCNAVSPEVCVYEVRDLRSWFPVHCSPWPIHSISSVFSSSLRSLAKSLPVNIRKFVNSWIYSFSLDCTLVLPYCVTCFIMMDFLDYCIWILNSLLNPIHYRDLLK